MKIQHYKFKVDDLKSIELDKNLSFPLMNIKSLCYLINYKTFKINGLYLRLLPYKINDLKLLKNHLLKMVSYYSQNKKDLYETEHIKFILDFPTQYEILKGFLNTDKTKETTEILKDFYTFENYIIQIKDTIKTIEKRINHYQKELKNKVMFQEFKINAYDLLQLENK